jgi:hypothetical protein
VNAFPARAVNEDSHRCSLVQPHDRQVVELFRCPGISLSGTATLLIGIDSQGPSALVGRLLCCMPGRRYARYATDDKHTARRMKILAVGDPYMPADYSAQAFRRPRALAGPEIVITVDGGITGVTKEGE